MSVILITLGKRTWQFIGLIVGTIHTPYETYRNLAQKHALWHFPFIASVILIYLGLAGLAKGGLAAHPLILTASFVKIVSVIVLTFVLSVAVLGMLGYGVNGDVEWLRLARLWAFTLLPTSGWFVVTSLFSLILPPPRTMSIFGQIASFVFIAVSFGFFLWKAILYYLTLRFGLKLDLVKISTVSIVFLPCAFGYSYVLYKLGIFRVPFL